MLASDWFRCGEVMLETKSRDTQRPPEPEPSYDNLANMTDFKMEITNKIAIEMMKKIHRGL